MWTSQRGLGGYDMIISNFRFESLCFCNFHYLCCVSIGPVFKCLIGRIDFVESINNVFFRLRQLFVLTFFYFILLFMVILSYIPNPEFTDMLSQTRFWQLSLRACGANSLQRWTMVKQQIPAIYCFIPTPSPCAWHSGKALVQNSGFRSAIFTTS